MAGAIADAQVSVVAANWATGVVVDGGNAYLSCHETQLRVIDVRRPDSPTEVGVRRVDRSGGAYDVDAADGYAVLGMGGWGVHAFDVSVPSAPTEVAQFSPAAVVDAVRTTGQHVYVADDTNGLLILGFVRQRIALPLAERHWPEPAPTRPLAASDGTRTVACGREDRHILTSTARTGP